MLLGVKSENNFILIDSACFLNCVCVWNVALFRHHFEMAIWSAAKLEEVLFSSSLICWNRSLLKQSKCWIVEIIYKCNRIKSTDYLTIHFICIISTHGKSISSRQTENLVMSKMCRKNSSRPPSSWNNGKEVPRWEVAEIQKMSPSTTGRCYCCH